MKDLVGRKYNFEDDTSMEVIQIKTRDSDTYLVTYHINSPGCIPRKLVMEYNEFINTFGHLFES